MMIILKIHHQEVQIVIQALDDSGSFNSEADREEYGDNDRDDDGNNDSQEARDEDKKDDGDDDRDDGYNDRDYRDDDERYI